MIRIFTNKSPAVVGLLLHYFLAFVIIISNLYFLNEGGTMDRKPLLFRKKSLDKISEPDQLTDYLRVSKPVVWLLLAAILIALAGLLSWSFIGTVNVTAKGSAVLSNGQAMVMLADNEKYQLKEDMKFTLDGQEETLTRIEYNNFKMPVGYAEVSAQDGEYSVSVVVKSLRPYELLFGV